MNRHQWPQPANWDEFEELALDLWSKIWNDQYAQRNGRQGQAQSGIDVYGTPEGKKALTGVQCKGKDSYVHAFVSKKELDAEIKKAESFKPGIEHFILATTAPQDANIQEYARKISEKRSKAGKFKVTVLSWDWIKTKLGDYPEIARKHGYNVPKSESEQIKELTDANMQDIAFNPSTVATGGSQVVNNLTVVQNVNNTENLHTEIDYAKKLLNKHHAVEALHFLEEIENKVNRSSDDTLKFRYYTNLGAANLEIDKMDIAAKNFMKAATYSNDEKAETNALLAHLIRNEYDECIDRANAILAIDPDSAKATSYKLQAIFKRDKKPLSEIIKLVPERIIEKIDISLALGFIADQENESAESRKWLTKALLSDTDDSVEIRSTLAASILNPIVSAQSFLGELTDEQKEDIRTAKTLLDEAWSKYEQTETKRYKTQIVYNRSLASRLLGNLEDSIRDNNTAVILDPSNGFYKKHLAILYSETGDHEKCIQLLREVSLSNEFPESKLLLAEELKSNDKDIDEAILLVEDFIESNSDPNYVIGAYNILLAILIQQGMADKALSLVDNYDMAYSELFGKILAAKYKRAFGDTEEAGKDLVKLKLLISDETPLGEVNLLGDELYRSERYSDACDIYEKVIDPKIASSMSRRLVNCYYRAGRHGDALKLCTLMRSQLGVSSYIVEMEASIYEDIGDLNAAIEICKAYLADNPYDNSVKIRLAAIYYRANKNEYVVPLIESIDSSDKLSANESLQLAKLYSSQDLDESARDILYEARRKYFDNPDIHLTYIGLFLNKTTGEDDPLLNIKSVALNTAVIIEKVGESDRTYIIDDRPDPSVKNDEVSPESTIGKKLVGKIIGDKVSIDIDDTWSIKEIKSKYVLALNESTSNYQKWFPDASGLRKITVGKGTLDESVHQLLKIIDENSRAVNDALKLYKDNQITVGSLALRVGHSSLDTVYALMGNSEIGLKAATASDSDVSEKIQSISEDTRFVIDLTSLIVIFNCNIAKDITEKFGKFIVPQSMVDALRQKQTELGGREESGYGTLSKQDGKYIRDQATPAQIKKSIDHITELLGFVEQFCEVTTVTAALDIQLEERRTWSDAIGSEFLDAILLAKEEGRILLSDDHLLRRIAQSEYSIEGTWTQIILLKLKADKLISNESYCNSTIELTKLHYRHARIDSDVLVEASKKAGWALKSPFTDVIKEMTLEEVTTDSVSNVLTEFLYELWKQPLLYEQRYYLVQYVLSYLAKRGIYDSTSLDALYFKVAKKFILLPTGSDEIRRMVIEIKLSLGLK